MENNLTTLSLMAKELSVDRDKVNYLVRKLGIEPIYIAGTTRLYDPGVLGQVREGLENLRAYRPK